MKTQLRLLRTRCDFTCCTGFVSTGTQRLRTVYTYFHTSMQHMRAEQRVKPCCNQPSWGRRSPVLGWCAGHKHQQGAWVQHDVGQNGLYDYKKSGGNNELGEGTAGNGTAAAPHMMLQQYRSTARCIMRLTRPAVWYSRRHARLCPGWRSSWATRSTRRTTAGCGGGVACVPRRCGDRGGGVARAARARTPRTHR